MRHFWRPLAVLLAGAVVAAALGLLVGQPAPAIANTDTPSPRTISVTGEATVKMKPDRATVRLGIDHLAETATAAHTGGAGVMESIVAAMKKLEIPEEHLQTSQITLHPEYEYVEEYTTVPDGRATTRGRQVLKGYRFRSNLTVTVDDVALVGNAIDAAVAAGANTVDSIQFTVRDEKAAKLGAQVDAIRHAREQAEQAARELGLTITGVQSVNLQNVSISPPMVRLDRDMAVAEAASMAAMPVLGGQVSIEVQAHITFLTN